MRWGVLVALVVLTGCDGGGEKAAPTSTSRPGTTVVNRLTYGLSPDIRCTADGVAVDEKELSASADGVHIRVENTTDREARLVVKPSPSGAHPVLPGTSEVIDVAPPGKVRLSCGPHGDNSRNPSLEVTVTDPQGFYRSVDLVGALGCEPDEYIDGDPPRWGATARGAAEAFAAKLRGEARVTEGNGYMNQVRQEFVLFVDGRGYGTLDAYPDRGPGRYRAAFGIVCSSRAREYESQF